MNTFSKFENLQNIILCYITCKAGFILTVNSKYLLNKRCTYM